MANYKTEQEDFWAGDFGNQYIGRNNSEALIASNLNFFSNALRQAGKINSCIEFGANVGMNLHALRLLYPGINLAGIEINKEASEQLAKLIGQDNVLNSSIFDDVNLKPVDLSLIKGVLIHINPGMLSIVYEKLYAATKKFILVAEYYNPTPVAITYRGHSEKLFKRDFAGEIMAQFSDLFLVDYGFCYKGDLAFPQDDITWFLMRKGEI